MKKFITATNYETYSREHINPDYIIKIRKESRIAFIAKPSGEESKYSTNEYWIEVDCGGKFMRYYIDENTYNDLVNMEK